jgi:hypothetical protein
MGFNKRYITKDKIMANLNNLNYISKLVNADALIMDDWSKKFFDNFNFDYDVYQKTRDGLIFDIKDSSSIDFIKNNKNFIKLKNISNIFINLNTNPDWLDIHLANSFIEDVIPDNISGKFNNITEYFIKRISDEYSS